jgi:hypothetical protein
MTSPHCLGCVASDRAIAEKIETAVSENRDLCDVRQCAVGWIS